MFFKKKQQPALPCHFRRFVAAKESWPAIFEYLKFRPKTNHPTLRKQSIDDSTRAAIKSSYLLLSSEIFEIITKSDNKFQSHVEEEALVFECFAFSSSLICNLINPESEDHELYWEARQSAIESISLMTLLANEDIENTFQDRIDIYDKASESNDREEFISDIFARILTYLVSGEHFSRIKIRYEDPANVIYRMITQDLTSHIIKKLKEMVSLIVTRELDEEESIEFGTEFDGANISEADSASRYHELIDQQIDSAYKFLKDNFDESKINGQFSLKTISVFIVHAAAILAISRNFPWLHETTVNGLVHTLASRTPYTLPNTEPPNGMFITYSSYEGTFMHEQAEIFDDCGLEAIIQNLAQELGDEGEDHHLLSEKIEKLSSQATGSYLPFLAIE